MSVDDRDLDRGLRAGFGEGDSVLSRLEETSGIVPRILLHDPGGEASPIVKPRGNGDEAVSGLVTSAKFIPAGARNGPTPSPNYSQQSPFLPKLKASQCV